MCASSRCSWPRGLVTSAVSPRSGWRSAGQPAFSLGAACRRHAGPSPVSASAHGARGGCGRDRPRRQNPRFLAPSCTRRRPRIPSADCCWSGIVVFTPSLVSCISPVAKVDLKICHPLNPGNSQQAEAPATPSASSYGLRSGCARRLAPPRLGAARRLRRLAAYALRARPSPPSSAPCAPQDARPPFRQGFTRAFARRLAHRAQSENPEHRILTKLGLAALRCPVVS